MALSHEALFTALVKDLSPHLTVDQEIAAYLGGYCSGDVADKTNFAACHLLNNVLKKFVAKQADDANDVALAGFMESNRLCEAWGAKDDWSESDHILMGTLQSVIHKLFSTDLLLIDNLADLSPMGDLGPGISAGCKHTDLYSKLYGSQLTASSVTIAELYQRFVKTMPRWESAEFVRRTHFDACPSICNSRLNFVPKSNETTRTICAEPTLNMWYQRAYGKILEETLKSHFSIDLSDQQDVNRELCRLGSIDGSLATIDLKSASDSISMKLVEYLFPRHAVSILKLLRCPSTELPNGDKVDLSMVSTMGNGFTFPLQTLLFSCMVRCVFLLSGKALLRSKVHVKRLTHYGETSRSIRIGNFGVFGDDIIIPTEMYGMMCRLLTLCGFRVNLTKSFAEGPFRESCGADFLNGINVRPVYLHDLQAEHSRFSFYNLLRYWSCRHNVRLRRVLGLLVRSVRYLPVPRSSPIEVGLHVPFSLVSGGLLKRDVNGSILYYHLTPRPQLATVQDENVITPRFAKRKTFNHDGLVLFALKGGLRDGSFALRPNGSMQYRLRRSITPNWDSSPLGPDPLDLAGWCRWSSDTMRDLSSF